MNKLPLEIQDKIWHIYYENIYYNSVVIKINDTNRKFLELDKYCYNMYCSFCIYSNIDDEISKKKLIDRCLIYNNLLLDMILTFSILSSISLRTFLRLSIWFTSVLFCRWVICSMIPIVPSFFIIFLISCNVSLSFFN